MLRKMGLLVVGLFCQPLRFSTLSRQLCFTNHFTCLQRQLELQPTPSHQIDVRTWLHNEESIGEGDRLTDEFETGEQGVQVEEVDNFVDFSSRVDVETAETATSLTTYNQRRMDLPGQTLSTPGLSEH